MATRNLSAKYLTLRKARHAVAASGSSAAAAAASPADEEAGLPAAPALDHPPPDAEMPEWVNIHAKITGDLNLIREKSQCNRCRGTDEPCSPAAARERRVGREHVEAGHSTCVSPAIRIDVAVAVRSLRLSSSLVRALQRLHATRLRVSFGDDVIAEQQSGIDSLTNEITGVRREAAARGRLL